MDDDSDITELKINAESPRRISSIRARPNVIVRKGQVLLETKDVSDEGKAAVPLKAQELCTIKQILVKVGDIVEAGQTILKIRKGCPHAVIMKDMCAECGADLRKNGQPGVRQQTVTAAIPMVHNIPELYVSNEHAVKLAKADVAGLLQSRRLVLLVDLDQTLIHTTAESTKKETMGVYTFKLGPKSPWFRTKLRPGTTEFLAEIRKYYELHICTFGTRLYAHKIAEILDPDGSLFAHRILSRDENLDPFLKSGNLKALFPVGDQMACIIDDREDVWNFAPNLVHVKPYFFFKNVGDINSPFPKSSAVAEKKESDAAKAQPDATKNQYASQFADEAVEEDADDYLLYLKTILTTIHSAYYQVYDEMRKDNGVEPSLEADIPDMKNIVPYVRRKVLKGCGLVFSGLFPQDVRSVEKERAFALCQSFGATVSEDIVPTEEGTEGATTHLIAAKEGTAKVTKARQMGVQVVGPGWLRECIRRWERVEEKLYPVPTQPETTNSHALFAGLSHHAPFGRTGDSNTKEPLSIKSLAGMSAEDIATMSHEVDDELGDIDLDDDEEDADDSKKGQGDNEHEERNDKEEDSVDDENNSMDNLDNLETSGLDGDSSLDESGDGTNDGFGGLKRAHDDSDDSNSNSRPFGRRKPKASRPDHLSDSSNDNSTLDKDSLSDDDDDDDEDGDDDGELGAMAAELERQLSEE